MIIRGPCFRTPPTMCAFSRAYCGRSPSMWKLKSTAAPRNFATPSNALASGWKKPATGALHFSIIRGTTYGTCPVDLFGPNAWGLFNMLGNVEEWVEDTWHYGYQNAPADGAAWTGRDPSQRVVRGGSWLDKGDCLRFNYRCP